MTGSIGIYLGVVQFFFAATWIVYVIYLPQLVAQAGLPKSAVAWILMLDQLVFVLADYASGVAADRVGRVVGRIGTAVVAATLLSCAAFLAMPFVAPSGSAAALIALIVVWAITSSALRAPPLALLGRHASRPVQPLLLACSLLGLGVANALQPYLGIQLRGLDPRLPFVISSVALALATIGIVVAERQLAAAKPAPSARAASTPPQLSEPTPLFLAAALFAALAFQAHVFIDSAQLYARLAGAAAVPSLLPLFWVGFNLAMFPFAIACRRWPAPRVMAAAAVVAACASLAAREAGALPWLVAAQLVAGAAWAGIIVAAFAWALARGGSGRAGTFAGMLAAVLALATLARMAIVSAGLPQDPAIGAALFWWPFCGWLVASAIVFLLRSPSPATRRADATGT